MCQHRHVKMSVGRGGGYSCGLAGGVERKQLSLFTRIDPFLSV